MTLVDMSSESVGLLSSPDRSSSPSLTESLHVNDYCTTTTQILSDSNTGVNLQQLIRSPGKRQLTYEESLQSSNDSKRLCNSIQREQFDSKYSRRNSLSTQIDTILPSPPSPPLSDDVQNWLLLFLAMSNDDRSRATEALIRTCSTNTLQLNQIKNQIEPYFQRDFIRDLPRELALHILKYLPACDVARASRTCRSWYETCNDILLWKQICSTQDIPYKQLPTIFDEIIDNSWKRSYACHKHLEYVWQHEVPLPEQIVFRGHEDFVITCLQFDGKRIVSGSDDNTLKVWSVATRKVNNFLFFPSNKRFLV